MLRELVFENPMLIDLKRALRKFFGVSKFTALNAAVLVLVILIYGLLLLVTASNRSLIRPEVVVILQTVLYCFVVPAMMHGAIASEREKRTWDLLLVAPLTNTQIVIGKFLGGVIAVLGVAVLLLPPAIMGFNSENETSLVGFLKLEMISIGWGIFLTAIALFVSSRSKRAFGSHLLIYAVQVGFLIVWAVFVFVIEPNDAELHRFLLVMHPFYAIGEVWSTSTSLDGAPGYGSAWLVNGMVQFVLYSLVSALLIAWTIGTLQLVDGNSLPRGRSASSK